MFKLEKLNVQKIVNSEAEKLKLISQGFKLIESKKEKDKEPDNNPDEQSENEGKTTNYEEIDYFTLKEMAKEKGITDYYKMKKEEIIAALKGCE